MTIVRISIHSVAHNDVVSLRCCRFYIHFQGIASGFAPVVLVFAQLLCDTNALSTALLMTAFHTSTIFCCDNFAAFLRLSRRFARTALRLSSNMFFKRPR